jgi:hypothetical protein
MEILCRELLKPKVLLWHCSSHVGVSGRVVPDALKQRSVFIFIDATVQEEWNAWTLKMKAVYLFFVERQEQLTLQRNVTFQKTQIFKFTVILPC